MLLSTSFFANARCLSKTSLSELQSKARSSPLESYVQSGSRTHYYYTTSLSGNAINSPGRANLYVKLFNVRLTMSFDFSIGVWSSIFKYAFMKVLGLIQFVYAGMKLVSILPYLARRESTTYVNVMFNRTHFEFLRYG